MGWIRMSERGLKRIEVLSEVLRGRRTVAAGAAVLAISERQAYRLLARYEAGGGAELIHKARGHTSNRSVNAGIRRYAVDLVKTRYADFGPTLATEVLLDKHQLRIGRETLRRWMVAEGLWLSRSATPNIPSTETAPRELRRAGADRRQPAPLVRATWRALHAAGVHRRCDQSADAATLRSEREHVVVLRSASDLS